MRAAAPLSPITVLIIDDDRLAARGIRAAIESSAELRVIGVAHSGEEAVAAYRSEPADLVLMDVDLGLTMTGIEATEQILKSHPEARVVIHTATAPRRALRRAFYAGARVAVRKDVSDAVLIATLRTVAEGGELVCPEGSGVDEPAGVEVRPGTTEPLPALTRAECEILRLICDGLDYCEIASRLSISVGTAETHAKRLRRKLGVKNLAQLIIRAVEYRFVAV